MVGTWLKAALFACLHASVTHAAVLHERASPSPTVTIANGTIVGFVAGGAQQFLGIPFAQPPVGPLRLRPARTLSSSFGTFSATATPKSCPQFILSVDTSGFVGAVATAIEDSPLFQIDNNQSEDCLTINVVRPLNASAGAKLPVLVWIYGGAFENGGTSMYDGSTLVYRSVALGAPVVYVSMNYRLGGFGFMAGKELAAEGSTNLGLRDQRLALEWVQDNIAAFGGDPEQVTIWGERAGSISVLDQMIINGGDNTRNGKPLFRGGVMTSGSVVPLDSVTAPQAQTIFNTVVNNAGCGSANDSLACLRALDYNSFHNAANSVPTSFGYRSLDLSYLPRPDPNDNFFSKSPELSVQAGQYAKVPIIVSDLEDEGTMFALLLGNITNNQEVIQYLASYIPGNPNAVSYVTGLVSHYPDVALGQPDGSPFRTGVLNNIYPEYKRLAAILGDITFTLSRRYFLSLIVGTVPTWSSLASFYHDVVPVLGTYHSSDLNYLYNNGTTGLAPTMQTYLISFVNHLDPNALGTPAPMIEWPQWTAAGKELLYFVSDTNTSLLTDDFRDGAYQYLLANPSAFRV